MSNDNNINNRNNRGPLPGARRPPSRRSASGFCGGGEGWLIQRQPSWNGRGDKGLRRDDHKQVSGKGDSFGTLIKKIRCGRTRRQNVATCMVVVAKCARLNNMWQNLGDLCHFSEKKHTQHSREFDTRFVCHGQGAK